MAFPELKGKLRRPLSPLNEFSQKDGGRVVNLLSACHFDKAGQQHFTQPIAYTTELSKVLRLEKERLYVFIAGEKTLRSCASETGSCNSKVYHSTAYRVRE